MRKPLPTWSKVMIAFVLVSMVGSIVLFVFAMFFLQKMARQATDPKLVVQVAKQIADFPEPLPNGYRWEVGVSVPKIVPIVSANLSHQPDNQVIEFLLDRPKQYEDAKTYLDRALQLGGNDVLPSQICTIEKRGEETIAGEKMTYIVGEFKSAGDNKMGGMVGCLSIKNKRKTILIYAFQPSGSPYNAKVTTDLLNSIKGF